MLQAVPSHLQDVKGFSLVAFQPSPPWANIAKLWGACSHGPSTCQGVGEASLAKLAPAEVAQGEGAQSSTTGDDVVTKAPDHRVHLPDASATWAPVGRRRRTVAWPSANIGV